MTLKKQNISLVLLTGLLLLFNLNCKNNTRPNLSEKDKLIISYIGDERIFHQDYWGMEATYWVFLPLVANVGDEYGEIRPVLAESWTHSDDYRDWTVQLRKDIYWHDGTQMTARDIKFTIDLKNKMVGFEKTLSCELIDDFSFRLTSLKPISNLPTWEVYYPKHLLENQDPEMYYDWDFWKKPVGNGPYKFVRNIPKTMVEVEANPEYFGPAPKIKKAILKFSNEPALQELISGNVDVLTYVPRDFLFKIERDDRFTSYHWWGGWVESILWNHNNTLFEEPLIRKALTMAINREELLKVLNYPDDVPITDVLSTRSQRQRAELPEALKFDPQKAKQILAESGWEDTDNDGILEKGGVDFSFTITTPKHNNLMATYIQNNLSNIGVNMEIETIEANIIRQKLNKNQFEAILERFPNKENAISRIRNYFDENSTIGYENRKLDSLLRLIELTGDKKEINRLYRQLMPIFKQDLPITLLVPQVQTHIVRKNIKGLSNLYRADPVWFMPFLWIDNKE